MGDAGIPPVVLECNDGVAGSGGDDGMGRKREVTVLVTGFGVSLVLSSLILERVGAFRIGEWCWD